MASLPGPAAVTDVLEDVRRFLSDLKTELPEVFRPRRRQEALTAETVEKAPQALPRLAAPAKGTVPYQGGRIDLYTGSGDRTRVEEVEGGIQLLLDPDESVEPAVFLREWYLKKAWESLRASSERWSQAMGLRYGQLRVKDQKTLWGSCSRDGNLNFNWRLILAPPPILDYVVIHELAHLKEMNHSKAFWSSVASWCPDYERRRDWLRDNEKDLRWDPRSVAFDG